MPGNYPKAAIAPTSIERDEIAKRRRIPLRVLDWNDEQAQPDGCYDV